MKKWKKKRNSQKKKKRIKTITNKKGKKSGNQVFYLPV